jgi:hypothetical protein
MALIGLLLASSGAAVSAYASTGEFAMLSPLGSSAAQISGVQPHVIGPEAPEATEVSGRRATSATLYGMLNPHEEGEPGSFRFLYRASQTECQGGAATGREPSYGGSPEAVAANVSELAPDTTYTFCLEAFNGMEESSISPPRSFTTALPPEAPEAIPATEVTGFSALLNGVLNPSHAGEPGYYRFLIEASATECDGEYVHLVSGGSEALGGSPEPVHARATGLLPDTQYTFCLEAQNIAGETVLGPPETFTTPVAAPAISEQTLPSIGATTATLSAQINPGGEPTTYLAEYGTSSSYGSTTSAVSAGAGSAPEMIRVELSGLASSTTYHVRLVASNSIGSSDGEDLSFTTAPGTAQASGLPDHRAYELVSKGVPEVYAPALGGDTQEEGQIATDRESRAAANGEKVAYLAEPSGIGGSGSQGVGEQYLASRTANGWESTDMVPAGASGFARYASFSAELSTGIFDTEYEDSAVKLSGIPSGACDPFFVYTTAGMRAVFTEPQGEIECGNTGNDDVASFAGASADGSHELFETQAALTPEAEKASLEFGYNLYDSVEGHLQQVNMLPGTEASPDPDASFGGPHGAVGTAANPASYDNVISSDGSHVFWTDLSTARIYVRENNARTIPISAGAAEYLTATPDGRYSYYIEGSGSSAALWRFDVGGFDESTSPEAQALAESREQLTASGSGVQGLVGINQTGPDNGYVYFVASAVLATNANSSGDHAQAEAPNLYLLTGRQISFLAALVPADNEGGRLIGDGEESGIWQRNIGDRTSEVTPDGRSLGFMSRARLTSYENHEDPEVYAYDSESGLLSCVSCNPTGAPPGANDYGAGGHIPTTSPSNAGSTYQARWISDDGARVFFDSDDPLLPQAVNHKLNVYEWERNGVGTCRQNPSCLYLLSGGSSPEAAHFLDASANGDDVFFVSREDLVGQAHGEALKLYDARVDGGFSESHSACTGSGCQGAPPAPPEFATPPSVTFDGIGNYPAAQPVKAKRTAPSRAARLAAALKQCRKRHGKRARHACEARAHRRYGPSPKANKPAHKHKTGKSSSQRKAAR